jgi:hypothetical protein
MASVRDVILVSVLMFTLGLVFFSINFVSHTITTSVTNTTGWIEADKTGQATASMRDLEVVIDRIDYMLFGFFIALVIGVIITGYFVGGQPIAMFFYFMILIAGVLISAFMSNAWYDVTTTSAWQTILPAYEVRLHLPITNNIMVYLPMYTSIIGLLGLFIMFSRGRAKSL